MSDEFKLVNNSNNKGLKFFNAIVVSDNVTVNNVSIAQAGGQSTSNFARNLGGFRRLFTVDFLLVNDGTDQSTDGSSKVTISQQKEHLNAANGVVQGDDGTQSDVKFTLTVFEDGATRTVTGSVEDCSVSGNRQEANVLRGTMNFFESGN